MSVRRRMEPETRRRCLALLHWEEKSLEQVEGEMIQSSRLCGSLGRR